MITNKNSHFLFFYMKYKERIKQYRQMTDDRNEEFVYKESGCFFHNSDELHSFSNDEK